MIFGISDTAIAVIYDHESSRFWFDRCPRTMPASFGAQVVIGAADASHKRTSDRNHAASIALTDACGFRFPKICSRLGFPEIAGRTWENGNWSSGLNGRMGHERLW